jgi:hypothetical protein
MAIGLSIFTIVVVLLQFTNGLSLTKTIDGTYINGTLTATGILLGFLTASVISGRKYLRQIHFSLVEGCVLWFVVAVVNITASEVRGTPTLSDYVTLQSALIFTGIVAFIVIRRISKSILIQHEIASQ